MAPVGSLAMGVGIGAVVGFFLDPDRGRSRRARTRDQIAAALRSTGRRVSRATGYVRASANGMASRLANPRPADVWIDDPTLAHKVETELFRDPTISKGSININAEHGTVVLRGAVDTQDEIERIMVGTMAIDGVRAVRSLLRLRADVERPFAEPAIERPEAVLTAR